MTSPPDPHPDTTATPATNVVVSGTFHRAQAQLAQAVAELESNGATITSPASFTWVAEQDGFVFAEGQEDDHPLDIELAHLDAIASADLVYLHAPGGYVGLSAALEIGFAHARGIPVYADCTPEDVTLALFVTVVDAPATALERNRTDPPLAALAVRHRGIYDQLADAYDERATALLPVTRAAVADLARHLSPPASILDVGCGAGLAVEVLADAGFAASGIDSSPRMTAHAAARNPHSTIHTGDVLTYPFIARYEGILGFAFIHLFPKRVVPDVLARIHDLLVDDGVLYLGTTHTDQPSEGFEAKADYPGAPARWRAHWSGPELTTALEDAGFAIAEIVEHTDAFDKHWLDVIARRA